MAVTWGGFVATCRCAVSFVILRFYRKAEGGCWLKVRAYGLGSAGAGSGGGSKLMVDSLPYSRQAENAMTLRPASPEKWVNIISARWGSSALEFPICWCA